MSSSCPRLLLSVVFPVAGTLFAPGADRISLGAACVGSGDPDSAAQAELSASASVMASITVFMVGLHSTSDMRTEVTHHALMTL